MPYLGLYIQSGRPIPTSTSTSTMAMRSLSAAIKSFTSSRIPITRYHIPIHPITPLHIRYPPLRSITTSPGSSLILKLSGLLDKQPVMLKIVISRDFEDYPITPLHISYPSLRSITTSPGSSLTLKLSALLDKQPVMLKIVISRDFEDSETNTETEDDAVKTPPFVDIAKTKTQPLVKIKTLVKTLVKTQPLVKTKTLVKTTTVKTVSAGKSAVKSVWMCTVKMVSAGKSAVKSVWMCGMARLHNFYRKICGFYSTANEILDRSRKTPIVTFGSFVVMFFFSVCAKLGFPRWLWVGLFNMSRYAWEMSPDIYNVVRVHAMDVLPGICAVTFGERIMPNHDKLEKFPEFPSPASDKEKSDQSDQEKSDQESDQE